MPEQSPWASSCTLIPVDLPLTTSPPAVAADISDVDSDECDSESDPSGISAASGDTAGPLTEDEIEAGGDLAAVAARRTLSAQPKNRQAGDMHPYHEPSVRNMRPDVGGISMFIGNWGERASKVSKQREPFDANIGGARGR